MSDDRKPGKRVATHWGWVIATSRSKAAAKMMARQDQTQGHWAASHLVLPLLYRVKAGEWNAADMFAFTEIRDEFGNVIKEVGETE